METFVFARISQYYVLLKDDLAMADVSASNLQFFSGQLIDALAGEGSGYYSRDDLTELFKQDLCFSNAHYLFKHNAKYAVLIPVTSLERRLPVVKQKQMDAITADAVLRVYQFRLETKKKLIQALFAADTDLKDYVYAWAQYLFCDHYSLWIYNRYTEVFTCSNSSFLYSRDYIFRSENSSLNRVLEEDYQAECRQPRKDRANYHETRHMRTLNRIKLDLGYDGTIGVLSFYSRHGNFVLKPNNHQEIKSSIETKYLQVRQQARQSMNEINQHFIESYKTGELTQFLYDIVCQVSDKFQCEACSIFLHEPGSNNLYLAATADLNHSGKPSQAASYDISKESFTSQVFNSRSMAFSYDLANDARNSGGYSESTQNDSANWIGVPLHYGQAGLGVLRVKNKYELAENGRKVTANFRNSDFVNLLSLCSSLSNLIRIEALFNEAQEKLIETSNSMKEMEDFNKVFLHEIRTPISKFTMAPELIKRTLAKKELNDEQLGKVMRQLDDIQVMGDRLEFIAKTFNFNQIVTRRDFQVLSVLRDIIFPVINITRSYLRKQYDIDIQLDTSGLNSCRVYGDKTLLNIVFNTLIDNAGKYSIDTKRPITVAGGYEKSGDYFAISVSNYGLPIHTEEKETLFDKGVRGKEVIRHGIGGTGIGLYLASRIMSEGNGELLLTCQREPVTFTIRIPARPKGSET